MRERQLYVALFLIATLVAGYGCAGRHNTPVVPKAQTLEDLKKLALAAPKQQAPAVGQVVPADYGVPIPNTIAVDLRPMSVSDALLQLVAAPGKAVTKSNAAIRPMYNIEGYCIWEVSVTTVTHWVDGKAVSQYSYISGVELVSCDDGYGPEDGPGTTTPDPTPAPAIPSASPGCTNGSSDDANVSNTAQKQMHDHLQQSINNHQEWAGFVYIDSLGDIASIGQFYDVDSATGEAKGFPSSPPPHEGWTPVAWFHDHPVDYSGSENQGVQTSTEVQSGAPYSNNYFSIDDENYSNANGITGYVGLANDSGAQMGKWKSGGTPGTQSNYTGGGLGNGC